MCLNLPKVASNSPTSNMWLSSLSVVLLAQSLSAVTATPFDQLLNFDGTEPSLATPDFLPPGVGFEDPIRYNPEYTATAPDLSTPLFPDTSFPGPSFDVALGGGGSDIVAATNECYPKERACCLGLNFSQCYYAPSAQCSDKQTICCSRIDSVSRDGFDCGKVPPAAATEPPVTDSQFGDEEYWGTDDAVTDEEWQQTILGW
jgi:hypothetical protein